MSLDQCHSTVGEKTLPEAREVSHEQTGVTGRKYWRSLDDLADRPAFREWLEREFTSDASRLFESSRRTFLKIMGASVALAGAATLPGCRRPDHKIYTYSKNVPEDVIPGKNVYYATSMPLPGGGAEGLLVSTVDGRPIKVEGNPLHPNNQGKSGQWAQASVLGLYDPERLKDPVYSREGQTARSWEDVAAWCKSHFGELAKDGGKNLAFLLDKKRSPSRDAVRARVAARFPKASWYFYDPIDSAEVAAGSKIAFGTALRQVLNLDKADVVVSLDRDFLGYEAGSLRNARGWASKRRVYDSRDPMSRLYVVEPRYTITGSKADHRLKMSASLIPAFAVALAKKVLAEPALQNADALRKAIGAVNLPTGVEIDQKFVDAVAADLLKDETGRSRLGKSLIVAGPTQPAAVHALTHVLNTVLQNADKGGAVGYLPMSEAEAASSVQQISELAERLGKKPDSEGGVRTLVTIGCNPVYDAPGNTNFALNFSNCPERITHSVDLNETVAASSWQLPASHYLESWGDIESHEGTLSPIQPMIAPLYGAWSELEFLALLAGDEKPDGHEIVRSTWKPRIKNEDFEKWWKRSLFNGVFPEQGTQPAAMAIAMTNAAPAIASALKFVQAPTPERLEVVFDVGHMADGRYANVGWLQELPDPITKVVWDNVAWVSPATAKKYAIDQDEETVKNRGAYIVSVKVGGQTVRVPAWVTPGVADNTVVLQFGRGRRVVGRVGEGTGFNVFPIAGAGETAVGRHLAWGAMIERVSDGEKTVDISSTQTHGSMQGRAIVREVDIPAWRKFADDPLQDLSSEDRLRLKQDSYGYPRQLNFAERLGELSHTPANYNIYENPDRGTKAPPPALGATNDLGKTPDYSFGHQWGMSIDLTTCTGCSNCTIACQAENNIPVVGKIEVNKYREMHWIRVDRYFSGEGSGGVDPDGVMFQPVACVHCENAPCETVCPVNATVHGPEGINYMSYQRCIGTRYCANNCPYKVRRFNFFDFGVKKFNGDYIGKETLHDVGVDGPKNVNLIPPRLRERLDEITKLGMNPNVTVRSRGVMEKCTYCIQRINEARVEIKLKNLNFIPDGFFQTACQQACPTNAIEFGDVNDTSTKYPMAGGGTRTGSRVSILRNNQRSYMLLGYLNTRPRTTHLAAIRNPNPVLADGERKARWDHPFHHGGAEHGAGGEGHEGGHGEPAHAKEEHGMLDPGGFDPQRAHEDRGYRMSLAVLGASA